MITTSEKSINSDSSSRLLLRTTRWTEHDRALMFSCAQQVGNLPIAFLVSFCHFA